MTAEIPYHVKGAKDMPHRVPVASLSLDQIRALIRGEGVDLALPVDQLPVLRRIVYTVASAALHTFTGRAEAEIGNRNEDLRSGETD